QTVPHRGHSGRRHRDRRAGGYLPALRVEHGRAGGSSEEIVGQQIKPKFDDRNPKEIRNPKSELSAVMFPLRVSGLGFLSDFGFRISDLTSMLHLLALDQSTSATKAVLFDDAGKVLDKTSRP